jgi:hypothetical protein
MPLLETFSRCRSALVAACILLLPPLAWAQSEGGLYIAGDGFGFQAAAQRALAQNPHGQRFFLLTLPPETTALMRNAPPALRRLRERVSAANGVLLVCRRDLDNRRIDASRLAPEVVPVRGWPAADGPAQPPAGQRYFVGENPEHLPASNEALRRLRATCS